MPSLLSLFSHGRSRPSPEQVSPQTFSATLMEENITSAEAIISKWDVNSPQSKFTPLFYDSRGEAARFCNAVHDLQRAMVFFSSADCLESPKTRSNSLVRAQTLMQSAMKRLEKEFYQILSANRDRLDPDSLSHRSARSSVSDSEDEIRHAADSIGELERASEIAMADLRTIAQAMISAGYGKECVKIYNVLRKSIVGEGLYRLGFETLTLSQIQKLDWEVLDLKIRSWLNGSGVAIRILLSGERILCDHIFEGSDPIRESCFAEITKEAAVRFLAFPELVAKSKRSPEKLFRILDLYNALSDLWTDIESVFSFESTAAVRSQALSTLLKLGEAARSTIAEFESAIQKDGSKSPVPGGGVHPLTRYVMNYLSFLADYEPALGDIFTDFTLQTPSPLPEFFFDSPPSSSSKIESPSSAISVRIAWLILGLLCKLDLKAEVYRDVALSYLFLANNLHYVVMKVRESGLVQLLGGDWVVKHEAKVRHYTASYERLAWTPVAAAIPAAESPEAAAEKAGVFYSLFEEAVRVQKEWVVADVKMREQVREMVAEFVVPAYRGFYETYRPVFAGGVSGEAAVVRYAPEDVKVKVMELFSGLGGSDSGSGSGSGSDAGSHKSSWWSSSSTH